MWNSVWHRRDPFLSSHILGTFLCLNHLTRPCVNNYESQGFFPVWELTSQEYNRDLQAMNMTHALKMDPFHQRGYHWDSQPALSLFGRLFCEMKKKKCISLLPSVRHPILERFIFSVQTRHVHQTHLECRRGQQMAITNTWPGVKQSD